MADVDKSSKTEPPSDKKLADAHKKGQFAKAPEIGVTFTLIAALIIFAFTGKDKAVEVGRLSIAIFGHLHEFTITEESVVYWANAGLHAVGQLVAPMFIAFIIAAIVAGGIQSKFRLTLKALKPSLNKINPISGIKRLFSAKTLVQAGVDFLKFVAVALIIWGAITHIMGDPIFHTTVHVSHTADFIFKAAGMMLIRLIAAIAIIAIINYLYQRYQTNEDLKMTKEEVKDEHKNADMDPKLKAALRRFGMKLLQKQMLDEVPTADVVVTNPTHYAIALRYERGRDLAPIVIAKGKDQFAQKIKAIAREHKVPMVENKPVARLLFRIGEVGEAIPVEVYDVVAKILSYVYRRHRHYFHHLNRRRKAFTQTKSTPF